jgi:hypothetical protein
MLGRNIVKDIKFLIFPFFSKLSTTKIKRDILQIFSSFYRIMKEQKVKNLMTIQSDSKNKNNDYA